MRRVAALVVGIVALAAAGCGVPTDDQPHALPRADVPFDLLEPAATQRTSTTQIAVTTEVPIYLVGPERLVVVRRLVESPSSLFRSLESLLAGPMTNEAAAGVRSAISNQTRLLSVRTQGGVATIDLSGDFAAIGGRDQILAVAQLVHTATAVPGVLGVRLSLDGKPVEVPRGDGTLTQEPLSPEDYSGLTPQ